MKNNKKKIAIIITVLLLIAVFAVVAIVLLKGKDKKDKYRIVKINSYVGEVNLNRQQKDVELFEGIKLVANDKVTTGSDGLAELEVDSDKGIVASENTCFTIDATGDDKNGKVTINLEYGTTLIEIENKLNEGSAFNVNTPNAALSVRGTTFEVTYNKELNETILSVVEGVVEAKTSTKTRDVNAGEIVIIRDDNIEDYTGAMSGEDTDGDNSEETTEETTEEVKEHDPSTDDFAHGEDILFYATNLETGEETKLGVKGFGELVETENEYTGELEYKYNGMSVQYFCLNQAFYDSEMEGFREPLAENWYETESSENEILMDEVLVNDDGDQVQFLETRTLVYNGEESGVSWAEGYTTYRYYKQLNDGTYLYLFIFGQQPSGQPELFLDLTKDCYYVYE